MLSSLNDSKTNNLYEISMQIIQTYFKHNFGKHSYESTSEDEQVSLVTSFSVASFDGDDDSDYDDSSANQR